MKTVTAILVVGLFTASAGIAGVNDQMAEERYRAKYGRYSPAEERRQHASEEARRKTAIRCEKEGCCHAAPQDTAEPARMVAGSGATAAIAPSYSGDGRSVHGSDAAARLQAKTGRTAELPRAATQARVRDTDLLAQFSVMCEHECCARH